jgi:ketosteroid isomerase-like protein
LLVLGGAQWWKIADVMSDTEKLVREYVEACNAGHLDRVVGLLHRDMEMHEANSLPGAISSKGIAAVRHYLERFGTHWSSFRWELLELRVNGERALMSARLHLRGRESGIAVARDWFYVFTVRDGKLLRQEGYDDERAAQEAFSATTEGSG